MSIDRNNLINQVSTLYTHSSGMQWLNLRLFAAAAGAPGGAQATLKINGLDIPEQRGAVFVQVDPTAYPQRTTSVDALFDDGDVLSVDVQGPSSVNIRLSGEVCSEQL